MNKKEGTDFQYIVDLYLKGRSLKTIAAAEHGLFSFSVNSEIGDIIESIDAREIRFDDELLRSEHIAIDLSVYSMLYGIAEQKGLLRLRDSSTQLRLYPRGVIERGGEQWGEIIVPVASASLSRYNYISHGIVFTMSNIESQFEIIQDQEIIRRTGLLGGPATIFSSTDLTQRR